jgi:hypothetical protein
MLRIREPVGLMAQSIHPEAPADKLTGYNGCAPSAEGALPSILRI